MKYLIIVFSFIAFLSCSNLNTESPENAIASYSGRYLNTNEVLKILPENLSQEDSIQWVEEYKRQWLENLIIIEKSRKNLPKPELDIEADLLQYKADILRHKYENFFIKNKINTNVSLSEIKTFYDTNKQNLLSNQTIVKGVYIEIPSSIKDKYKINKWLVSKKEKDQEKLKDYCFKNATIFDDFDNNWIELKQLQLITKSDKIVEKSIRTGKIIETKNEGLSQFIQINKILPSGSIMPLEYAKPEIIKLIINNRKIQLLKELDLKINQDVEYQINKK